MTHHYHVNAWIPLYAAIRSLGTMALDDIPEHDGRGIAAGIIARFAEEGLRATVAPVNDDGTVPSRATITVYGPVKKGRVTA